MIINKWFDSNIFITQVVKFRFKSCSISMEEWGNKLWNDIFLKELFFSFL